MDEAQGKTLSSAGNWIKTQKNGRELIFRYLTENKVQLWMMEIGEATDGVVKLHKPSKTRKLRVVWRKSDVRRWLQSEMLRHVEERGIPSRMSAMEIPAGVDPELDDKRELVQHIEKWGDDVIMSEQVYIKAMRDAASLFDINIITVKAWFERSLFYGGHENANVVHNWNKGGPSIPRRGLRDEKGQYLKNMGRPTDAERIDPNTPYKRKRLTSRVRSSWCNFIKLQVMGDENEIHVILDKFKLTRVGYNCAEDGSLRTFPIDPKFLPDDVYMKKIGRPVLRLAQLARDKERLHQPGYRRRLSGGNASELAHGDLSVLDIDATPADNYLLYGDEQIIIDGYGKPTVLLAVDRGSDAIVGWFVTFGTENADCYKSCIFSAYTPKERELARWGVSHLKGMVYGCASQIFIDRGPGMSERAQLAIVSRLRTDMLIAMPGDPRGKGHGEEVMGMFQRELAHIQGSVHTTGDPDIDRQRRLTAKKKAIPMKVFMATLLTVISMRNLRLDARHLLTDRMLRSENKPAPVPIEIYLYNKGTRRGDFDWDWPEETIYRNLCEFKERPARDGKVKIKKHVYFSSELKALASEYKKLHGGKTIEVKTWQIPCAPSSLIWEQPDGSLDVLDATPQSANAFGDGFAWEHDFIGRLKNRARLAALHKSRKAPSVMQTVSAATQRDMEGVERNAAVTSKRGGSLAEAKAKAKAKELEEKQRAREALELMGSTPETTPKQKSGFAHDVLAMDPYQRLFTDF